MDRYPLQPFLIQRLLRTNQPPAPFTAILHITTLCNLQCEFCWHHSFLRNNRLKPSHVPLKDIRTIISELACMGTSELTLSAKGEPACHPDFAEIVSAAKDYGFKLTVVTNGSLYAPHIISAYAKADHLMINLTTYNEATYKQIHAPLETASLSRTIQNLRFLSNRYQKKGHPLVALGYLIDKNTFRHINDALNFARSCGIPSVRYKLIDPSSHTQRILLNKVERAELLQTINIINTRKTGVAHNLLDIQQELLPIPNINPSSRGRCLVPLLLMNLSENGSVSLCSQNKKLIIGNWKKASLSTIWNSRETKRIQSNSRKNFSFRSNLWKQCRDCSFAQTAYYIERIKRRNG